MAGYLGGQVVKGGYYLKHATREMVAITRGGGTLPGNRETGYSRLPLPAVMVLGPLMGLAYVIIVPILVCLFFIYSLARLGGQKVKVAGHKNGVLTGKVR